MIQAPNANPLASVCVTYGASPEAAVSWFSNTIVGASVMTFLRASKDSYAAVPGAMVVSLTTASFLRRSLSLLAFSAKPDTYLL